MEYQDRYNSERYLDMTAYLAMRNVERQERRGMKPDWVYRRGDIYLANLNPYFGSEQGGVRPVIVLQNNTGNFFCPTLIIAPITSHIWKKPDQPTHYILDGVRGLTGKSAVLFEQIDTIDKRRVLKYLGRASRQQMEEIGEYIKTSLGLFVSEDLEAP